MLELNRSVSLSQLQQRVLKLEHKFHERLETLAGGGSRGGFCWDVPASVAAVREDCGELLRRVEGLEDRLQSRSAGEEAIRKRFGRLESRLEQQVCTQELATSTHEALLKRQGAKLHGLGRASEDFAARVEALEAALQRSAEVSASVKGRDEDGLPSTCASNTRSAGVGSSLHASPTLSLRATHGCDGHSVVSLDSEDRGRASPRGAGRAPSSAGLCSEDARTPPGGHLRDVDVSALDELHVRVDIQERDLAELSQALRQALAEAEASLGQRPRSHAVPRENVDRLVRHYEDSRAMSGNPPCAHERPGAAKAHEQSLDGVAERLEDLVGDVSDLYQRLVVGEQAGRKFQEDLAALLEAQMRDVSTALETLGASVGEVASAESRCTTDLGSGVEDS